MENKSSLLIRLGYLWIILPIIIFFIGYCNLYTSIIGVSFILIASYFLFKSAPKIWIPQNKKEWFLVIFVGIISILWVYSSGIGAFAYQNTDHNCRNPIFELMVTQEWPVIDLNRNAILTYYTGFWFVPALIGKLFKSINVGYITQLVWASIGVFLFLYYFLAAITKKSLLPIIIVVFFSGMDIIGKFIFYPDFIKNYDITAHIEWWATYYQFSSMTTQLYWVFNQALPAWILTILLYHQKNNKNILFLYTCLFLFSTLPAIGLLPFIIYFMVKNGEDNLKNVFSKEYIKKMFKNAFSVQNIIGLLIVFPVCYFYLSANISGGKFEIFIPPMHYMISIFLLFFMLEAGIQLLLIAKLNKFNPLFHICFICLWIFPFLYVGTAFDFCMRATIPALVILCLLIVKALENNEKFLYFALITVLVIGAITPIHEFSRTIKNTLKGITKVESNLGFENFYGYISDNKFLKYFGKQVKN